MSETIAQTYIEMLARMGNAHLALLACSPALCLDDEAAYQAIKLVASSNGSTSDLLQKIKRLSFIRQQWDGSWYIAEEIRTHLQQRFYADVPEAIHPQLHALLADQAERRAEKISAAEQSTAYQLRQAKFEAGYQRLLVPEEAENGAERLVDLWEDSDHAVQKATEESVDYLIRQLGSRVRLLPPEILFFRGMVARDKNDEDSQRKYFLAVWEHGLEKERREEQPHLIHAIAAHLFGRLVDELQTAERAFEDSIRWNVSPQHQAQVYLSWGKRVSRLRDRFRDAEDKFNKSIAFRDNNLEIGYVYNSLGNLLSKRHDRWRDAEKAYRKSIEFRKTESDKAKVYHSLGNLLSQDQRRWDEAEVEYKNSIDRDNNRQSRALTWHSYAILLAKRVRRGDKPWAVAENAYKKSLDLDHVPRSQAETRHSYGRFLAQDPSRWADAENAYRLSYNDRKDPVHRAQVLASWAELLLKYNDADHDRRAEDYAWQSLDYNQDNQRDRQKCYLVLAELYKRRGESSELTRALEELAQSGRGASARKRRKKLEQTALRLRRQPRRD